MEKLIQDKRKKSVDFDSIENGECFTIGDLGCYCLYMKIPLVYNKHKDAFNAINIKSGELVYYEDDQEVQDIASLRIEIL